MGVSYVADSLVKALDFIYISQLRYASFSTPPTMIRDAIGLGVLKLCECSGSNFPRHYSEARLFARSVSYSNDAIWNIYLTVKVPYIPACRCPGASQKKV